ncbi:MAG: CPBP family intramembrane metalloprotease [Microbacteriaceae bacterium]|nr:CPBP family intramembrane metalloprotease [Microbacteriaceae bacterium]
MTLPRAQQPPAEYGALPYHRLFRGLAGFRAWRPVVAIVVAAAIYLAASTIFVLVIVMVAMATGELDMGTTIEEANEALLRFVELDAASPLKLVLALGSVILMLPSALLGQLAAGLRPLGVRHSVAFRIRWRWFLVSMVPAFVTIGLGLAIPIVLSLAFGVVPFGPFTTDPVLFAVCAVLVLVLTPFQAAAEEYVFRGLFAQAIGSWVRYAWVGWIVTTALFVAGHVYDAWGLLSVGAFGLGAAIVASRTGGLEAGIAVHTVNNISGFLILASGVQGTTVNPTDAGPDVAANLFTVGVAIATTALWVYWVDRLAKRRGLITTGGMLPPPTALDQV